MQTTHLRIASSVVALLFACTASADKAKPKADTTSAPAPTPKTSKPAGPTTSPETRGRAILAAQLAALANEDAFIATFAKQATVLTPIGTNEVHGANAGVAAAIAFLNPHAEVASATFDHFSSGGNAHVSWFGAELHIKITSHEPGSPTSTETHTLRAIELLDGEADWKVAVAAFTNVAKLHTFGTSSINDPTDAGPLTNLLLSPDSLATTLDNDAVVFGTDPSERASGTSEAKALLAKWKKLTITLDPKSKVHEVRTSTFGYSMTNVRITTKPGGEALKLSAFVLAIPAGKDSWSVVGASYGALF